MTNQPTKYKVMEIAIDETGCYHLFVASPIYGQGGYERYGFQRYPLGTDIALVASLIQKVARPEEWIRRIQEKQLAQTANKSKQIATADLTIRLRKSFGFLLSESEGGWLHDICIYDNKIFIYARKDRLLPKHLITEFEGIPVEWIMLGADYASEM